MTKDAGRARERRWCAYLLQPPRAAGPVEKLFRLICGPGENTVKNPSKVLLIPGIYNICNTTIYVPEYITNMIYSHIDIITDLIC